MKNNDISNLDIIIVIALITGYYLIILLAYKFHSYILFCFLVSVTVAWLSYILTPQKVVKYITIIYSEDKPIEVKEVIINDIMI